MSRRSTPERIDEARQAAARNRFIAEGMDEELVERWIAAWLNEAEAWPVERSHRDFWTHGQRWIAEQRSARNVPA